MTDTLTDLIRELRQRARVYTMVGDKTPSGMMSRAADALESLNASVDRAAQEMNASASLIVSTNAIIQRHWLLRDGTL